MKMKISKSIIALALAALAVPAYAVAENTTKAPEASDIQARLSINVAPTVLEGDRWAVLLIEQTYKDESDVVTLKESVLETRALFAKKLETSGNVDSQGTWKLRTQVYFIKPSRGSDTLKITPDDFRNVNGRLKQEFVITQAPDPAATPKPTAKADDAAETAAKEAAFAWLSLMDSGKYAQSHAASAGFMRNTVSQEQFVSALGAVRTPLGAVESRKLKDATFATQMPGLPDGQYVALLFDTVFANKKESTIEHIVLAKDKDGTWKVGGYGVN